jgi:integrase
MAVRKMRNAWWVDFRVNHLRHRIRSPENSKTGAQAYEANLRQKLARGESIEPVSIKVTQIPTFGEFAWQWFETYVVTNNKPSEQRTKKVILQSSLIPFFDKKCIEEITAYDIEQYKAHSMLSGVSSKTINNRLTVLHKCLATAYEWHNLPATLPKMKWMKCQPPKTDYLSPEECTLLLSVTTNIAYELILMALRTGMRQGELKGLQWTSIDWQNRNLLVRHSLDDISMTLGSPKNNRERTIPLDTDVYETLFRRKKASGYVFTDVTGKPLNKKRLAHIMKRATEQVGIRSIGWHVLRHTFASQLATRGVPLNNVQTLLGHSSIVMTMRYAHTAPSALRSAIDMLNPKSILSQNFGQPVGNRWIENQQRELVENATSPK